MIFNKYVHALATAAMVAVTILIVPIGEVHARDNNPGAAINCELKGYVWSDELGKCAELHCQFGGVSYKHGAEVSIGGHNYMCNGFSGYWERWGRTQAPEVPQAPRPTTNAPRTTIP
jgi:hypothetical protein